MILVQAIERAAQESGELSWASMNAALTLGPVRRRRPDL